MRWLGFTAENTSDCKPSLAWMEQWNISQFFYILWLQLCQCCFVIYICGRFWGYLEIACSSPNNPNFCLNHPRTKTNTPPNENMSALITFACGMLIKHLNNPSLAMLWHLPKAIPLASKTNPISSWNHSVFRPNLTPLFAEDTWAV